MLKIKGEVEKVKFDCEWVKYEKFVILFLLFWLRFIIRVWNEL